jgi:hypothetical protein
MGKKKTETLENIKPKKKLNSGFYHEYLERAYLSGNILHEVLVEHSVYHKHPAIAEKVDQILSECADLYQLIGGLLHVKCEEEESADAQPIKKT